MIGIIAALALKNSALDPRWILFLKVGICGGFTTFSSFALESCDLLGKGNVWIAFLYLVLNVALESGSGVCGTMDHLPEKVEIEEKHHAMIVGADDFVMPFFFYYYIILNR